MRFTAERLAELTAADPAQAFPPSPEQKVIIEADPAQSMKVTAGAGSVKTTVISQRVVWLVANEYVSPEEILGLTFTRKAVGELGGRIRVLLSRLRHNLGRGQDLSLPGLDNPTVSTYNSYAASIVSEHGMSIGIEPETVLLDDAAAHTLAGNLIDSTPSEEIPGDFSRETMIADIIALAGQMNDHGRDVEEVTDYLEQCLAALVSSKGKPVDPNGRRAKLEAKIRTARLADAYMRAKRRNLAMDFSDQVRFAQRILDEVPAAAEAERARWKIVLLDEFQDTSVAQLKLLRDLFHSTAVTAVGDPRQAIYGWRGASADNMVRFSSDFRDVESLSLSTSWRNDRSILQVPIASPPDSLTAMSPRCRLATVPETAKSTWRSAPVPTTPISSPLVCAHSRNGSTLSRKVRRKRCCAASEPISHRWRRPWKPPGSPFMCTVPPGC